MKQQLIFSWQRVRAGSAVLVLVLGLAAGCKNQQQAARSDQQIATDVQTKIYGDSALSGQNIQVSVSHGVATLSGSVIDETSRTLAGNDGGTIAGVKTVVNNLTVEPVHQAAAPQPQIPEPAPTRASRARSKVQSHDARNLENTALPDHPQLQVAQEVSQPTPAPLPPPPPPKPVAKPVVKQITLPEGTVVPIRITETLDSKTAQPNQVFHGTVATDLGTQGVIAIPRGTSVLGRIVDSKEAAHFKGSALLSIELTELTLNGKKVALETEAFSKEGAGRGKNTAEKAAGGAALGAIIGAIAGGGKGAAIGSVAGAGAGTGVNAATRGQEVVIPTETMINFRLQSPITVTVTVPPAGGENGGEAQAPQLQTR